jgi:glycosyltransferase involved in cell wall biosynthesis
VGPVLNEVAAPSARVGARENVHLLGERSSDDVVAYVKAFDVGVIWFVVNHLTEAVSPLKLFEYLAAGTPAVSTPLPAAAAAAGGVRLAATAAEMAEAIGAALSTPGDPGERRRAAEAADWSRRIEPLIERLEAQRLRRVPG